MKITSTKRSDFAEGIECPHCGIPLSRVCDTRHKAQSIRRRRECANGHRFTTDEKARAIFIPNYQI